MWIHSIQIILENIGNDINISQFCIFGLNFHSVLNTKVISLSFFYHVFNEGFERYGTVESHRFKTCGMPQVLIEKVSNETACIFWQLSHEINLSSASNKLPVL